MIIKKFLSTIISLLFILPYSHAQEEEDEIKHADPVFEDLTTALGVEKGENELNINFGYRNMVRDYHTLLGQLEYEFAPADNLGFEILLPFTIYFPNPLSFIERPANTVEFLSWTGQYTFFQASEKKISLALGLENTFESTDPYKSPQERKEGFSLENIQYFPFLIVAKNWQDKFFILFKGGPILDHKLDNNAVNFIPQLHSAIHYSISEEDENYVGLELNKTLEDEGFEMYIRPQLILELSETFDLGVTIGIPVKKPEIRWSTFFRLAYDFN